MCAGAHDCFRRRSRLFHGFHSCRGGAANALCHGIALARTFVLSHLHIALPSSTHWRESPSRLALQRVVGAALEYADDPLEVSKLDVLHVLRKNKRFLSRVVTTYEHLEKFKEKKGDSSTFGPCNKGEQRENVLATRTFDDEAAPATSTRHDFSDAGRDAADGQSAAPRISIKVRKTA